MLSRFLTTSKSDILEFDNGPGSSDVCVLAAPHTDCVMLPVTVNDGEWHRLGFARRGTSYRYYVDDILLHQETTDAVLEFDLRGMHLGRWEGNDLTDNNFRGDLDQLTITTSPRARRGRCACPASTRSMGRLRERFAALADRTRMGPAMGEVYDEFVRELAEYQERYAGDPDGEMRALWLMALEREQIVAVGYQDELIRRRLVLTGLPDEVQTVMRQALVWAWKDEEMHAIYIRGALLKTGGFFLRIATWMQQWAGAVGGWVSSVSQNVAWRQAPLSRALAAVITWMGLLTGKVSRAVRKQLRHHSFRDFCLFNIEAERTAALAWGRLAQIAARDPERAAEVRAFRRMQEDEERHARMFEAFAAVLTPEDALAPGESATTLAAAIADIGEVFLPRALRTELREQNPLGSGQTVVVTEGRPDDDKLALFRRTLEHAGLERQLAERARVTGKDLCDLEVAVKASFMMAYDARDRSMVIDVELLSELVRWLRERGVRHLSVLEAPNLYDRFYEHRTVHEVARYLGIDEDGFRLVDAADEQTPHSFVRGMGQYSIAETWRRADVRLSFAKMRSHAIEHVYLTIANVDCLGGRVEEYLFADRQADRDAALMTVLSDFPPHFGIVDAYDLAADGLMGVMGCPRPKTPRRLYAGPDALAVDLVAARHTGLTAPQRFPILRAACYWFGDPMPHVTVDGPDTPIDWRGPYATELSTMLSFLASPVYEFGSGRGALFVADMDERAFPPREPEGLFLRAARRMNQMLLGLRLDP